MATTGILYFSETNNTKCAAEYLAQKTGFSAIQLKGTDPNNVMKGMLHGSTTPINDPWTNIQNFDRIILLSPIYAFNGIPVIRGFLKEAVLKGKEIFLITSGAGPAGKISEKVTRQYQRLITKANGLLTGSTHILGGDMNHFAGEEHHHQQVDGIFEEVQNWLAK